MLEKGDAYFILVIYEPYAKHGFLPAEVSLRG